MKGMLDNAKHYRGLNSYMFDLIKERRAAPKDDLISLLLEARVEGERLQDVDIVGFVGILLLGGISTSSALVTNIALLFDRAPDAWREVRADRSLVPAAIEEIVRLRPSFTNARRMTSCETELGGHVIPEGRSSGCGSPPQIAMTRTSRIRTDSTSIGPETGTLVSAMESTTASALHWPGWRGVPPSISCWTGTLNSKLSTATESPCSTPGACSARSDCPYR